MRNPHLLNTLLDHDNCLQRMYHHALKLNKLNEIVQIMLPTVLQPHCRVANYRECILILETDSAIWLNRLRYEQLNLLSTLRSKILPSLASISIQINPYLVKNSIEDEKTDDLPIQIKPISSQSAQILNELAEKCPQSLQLKLKKLANHAQKAD